MLACLVAIPLVAVSGGSLPRKIEMLLAECLPTLSAANSEAGEPPRFQPTHAAALSPVPLTCQITGQTQGPAAAGPSSNSRLSQATNSTAVIPAAFETPAPEQPAGENIGPREAVPGQPAISGQIRPVRPSSLHQPASGSDPFSAMQARLQQLGATYVLLESMGNRQDVYRCYCRMAIGGDPSYAYYFEALDSAPLEAMAKVVRQVEQWRAGRP